MFRIALPTWLMLASSLAAQYPLLTSVPSGNPLQSNVPAVAGLNGEIWVAGTKQVMRLDREGRPLFTTTIPLSGGITAIAASSTGSAAMTFSDGSSGHLLMLNAEGRITLTRPIAGIPYAIAVHPTGDILIAGRASDGFVATEGAYKTSFGDKFCFTRNSDAVACADGFLSRFSPAGNLVWSTLFGGAKSDVAKAIAIDPTGSIWIAGETLSPDMPTTAGAPQPSYGGGETLGPLEYGDAFVARFDAEGKRLEFATFLGGARYDEATTIAASTLGLVVGGSTESPNFPVTANGRQRQLTDATPAMPGLHTDAFVALLGRNGQLAYASYFGEAGQQTASAAALGPNNTFAVSIAGTSRRCLLRLDASASSPTLTPECVVAAFQAPFTPVYSNNNWYAIGHTKPGLNLPGGFGGRFLTAQTFGGDNPAPAIVGVWNEDYPLYRPVITPDSFISIYMPSTTNLSNAFVRLGATTLRVLFAGNHQINAYVPSGVEPGTYPLTVAFPFFSGIPVAVDVTPRWPGLASAALNQDGTVNTAANPAARGTIVSLFGSGFGPTPLPVAEPYIQATGATTAQGMEVLFAGRVGDGLFQVNARVPQNAVAGHTPVRIVLRDGQGLLQSNLARIYVQ